LAYGVYKRNAIEMTRLEKELNEIRELGQLVTAIEAANNYFLTQVKKQVNTALTLRNWIIGQYIVEYEQKGEDRAKYGQQLFKEISRTLKKVGLNSISDRHLYIYKDFYLTYPEILQTPSAKSYLTDFQSLGISQTVSAKSEQPEKARLLHQIDYNLLLNRLSFSHFIELLKIDYPLKRSFYEIEIIKNNWSVRELQRSMSSMLFERTGLSSDKQSVLDNHHRGAEMNPDDIFRNPYVLEFLGLEEKLTYQEPDLEEAIINHLQGFLLELGRGFCFEARQKRITFDNTHYRIDLVFYHRILRCHILLDLKLGEFTHADAGQMNVYLNYYKENETQENDNPPIGIILCAGKNETLVKYATSGLSQKVFVSKYLINLPSEEQLKEIIEKEQDKIQK
jgi:predicted nuclease of restriction endonuclease-like (RecB) superfamily